ncbi:MAG: hypothetical protein RL409_1030 [Gemmatimonadota bacterium]|jgi:copper(I)-binding protein
MTLRALPARRLPLVMAMGAAISCTTASAPPVERFVVRSSWARIADSGATSGAYLEIANNDSVSRSLVAVITDDAAGAEVHETMQHEEVAHMMPRTDLPIAAGAVLTMQPGGLHVMLVDMRRALAVGDSVRLRLRFSDSTDVPVTVPVKTP